MLQYIKQNKQIIMVAVTLFVLSMSTTLFFFGSNGEQAPGHLKTDVLDHGTVTESIDVKSLQETEKNYRSLMNNQEDPVFAMNVDGTIKFASWDVENILEYKPEELSNQIYFLLINPEDLSPFLSAFGKVIQDKKPVTMIGPYRLRDQNGEYHLHVGSMTPVIVHGEVKEIVITSKDISKQVEEEEKEEKKHENKKPVPKSKKIMNQKNSDHGRFLAGNPHETR